MAAKTIEPRMISHLTGLDHLIRTSAKTMILKLKNKGGVLPRLDFLEPLIFLDDLTLSCRNIVRLEKRMKEKPRTRLVIDKLQIMSLAVQF